MGGFVDAELSEDLLDVGAADEDLVVEDGDRVPVGEDTKVGSFTSACSRRSSASSYSRMTGSFTVSSRSSTPFGRVRWVTRVVHQPARDVDLPDRATSPGDDLGGEHGPYAGLLADRQQQRVHAGGVGTGQLGDVPDAHQLGRRRIAPVDLGVALEGCHEAEADRLDDRDR